MRTCSNSNIFKDICVCCLVVLEKMKRDTQYLWECPAVFLKWFHKSFLILNLWDTWFNGFKNINHITPQDCSRILWFRDKSYFRDLFWEIYNNEKDAYFYYINSIFGRHLWITVSSEVLLVYLEIENPIRLFGLVCYYTGSRKHK